MQSVRAKDGRRSEEMNKNTMLVDLIICVTIVAQLTDSILECNIASAPAAARSSSSASSAAAAVRAVSSSSAAAKTPDIITYAADMLCADRDLDRTVSGAVACSVLLMTGVLSYVIACACVGKSSSPQGHCCRRGAASIIKEAAGRSCTSAAFDASCELLFAIVALACEGLVLRSRRSDIVRLTSVYCVVAIVAIGFIIWMMYQTVAALAGRCCGSSSKQVPHRGGASAAARDGDEVVDSLITEHAPRNGARDATIEMQVSAAAAEPGALAPAPASVAAPATPGRQESKNK